MENYEFNLSDYDINNNGVLEAEEADALLGDVKSRMQEAERRVSFGLSLVFLIVCLISAKSNFFVFKPAFADEGFWVGGFLALLCLAVLDGGLCLLVYGFKSWFSTRLEKALAGLGIVALFGCMTIGVITHAMAKKPGGLANLNSFQIAYMNWGAWLVLIGVAALALGLMMAHPLERLLRKEIRILGRERETEINAKDQALRSPRVSRAAALRANRESHALARKIAGAPQQAQTVLRPDTAFITYETEKKPKK